MPSHDLKLVRFDLTELTPYHRNPRRGDVEAITRSLEINGQYRPIVVNLGTRTTRPLEVLAGNHTLAAAKALGWAQIDAVTVDVDDMEAARIVAADNRTADLGGYDNDLLIELLGELEGLDGTGYTQDDIDSLLHYETAVEQEALTTDTTPKPRALPLDLIFSCQGATGAEALMAYRMGWNPGIITTAVSAARRYVTAFPNGKPIMFMDNEWHDYNHQQHIDALAEFKPKYGTVRDLVTTAQAKEAGIRHYSIDETLTMAEDVAQHVDNVILIPKWDCIDQLPREIGGKRIVLGYSVQSSYGGTEVPVERFQGWPVHLLGGSWKRQRSLIAKLRDDVVSIDMNQQLRISQFGQFWWPDGETADVSSILGVNYTRNQSLVAVTISLANILQGVRDEYQLAVNEDEQEYSYE